jgi:hypothetical protein
MHDDLGLYALGALDDPSEFEAHLATCEECRRELAEIQGALELADDAVGDFELPAGLKERTLEAVRTAPASNVVPLRRPNRFFTILAAAAVTVVAVGVGSRVILTDRFAADRILSLAAPDGGPARATAKVEDTPNGPVVQMDVHGLPDAPKGTFYECWFVGAGDDLKTPNRVSVGTFRQGDTSLRMQSSADPSKFPKMGVTLEPDDGNPARTGPKVLATVSVKKV